MRFTHILLWVADNTLSEKFYKKLGFEVTYSDDQYSEVMLGDFKIGLITMRDEEEFAGDAIGAPKGKGMYIYIATDDVDKTYKRCVDCSLTPVNMPRDWGWGNREFVIKDPDGYKLCIFSKI